MSFQQMGIDYNFATFRRPRHHVDVNYNNNHDVDNNFNNHNDSNNNNNHNQAK